MKKIEFIDTIYGMMPYAQPGAAKQRIASVCDIVYAQFLSRTGGRGSLDLYAKEYPSQDVKYDSTRERYYTILPVEIVSVAGVSSGVRHVNTNAGMDLDFVPTTETEMNYLDGSDVAATDTTVGYWLAGDRIWYNDSMDATLASAGVRLTLIPRFAAFDRNDIVNIPGATDAEFISAVLQFLGTPNAQ